MAQGPGASTHIEGRSQCGIGGRQHTICAIDLPDNACHEGVEPAGHVDGVVHTWLVWCVDGQGGNASAEQGRHDEREHPAGKDLSAPDQASELFWGRWAAAMQGLFQHR